MGWGKNHLFIKWVRRININLIIILNSNSKGVKFKSMLRNSVKLCQPCLMTLLPLGWSATKHLSLLSEGVIVCIWRYNSTSWPNHLKQFGVDGWRRMSPLLSFVVYACNDFFNLMQQCHVMFRPFWFLKHRHT